MRILNQQDEVRAIARKSIILVWAIIVSIILLTFRLSWLQLVKGEENLEKSRSNFILAEKIFPARGDILSGDGKVLATTSAQFKISVLPILLGDKEMLEDNTRLLASLLSIGDEDAEILTKELRECKGRCRYTPKTVLEEVSKEDILKLSGALSEVPGVIISSSYKRLYPLGAKTAHLTGYVSKVTKRELQENPLYDSESITGKNGIEKSHEAELHGSYGEAYHVIDYIGRRIDFPQIMENELPPHKPEVKGSAIQTSILTYLQATAEKALEGQSGAIVVMEIATGRILAMYSSPSYDPNLLARIRIPRNVWLEYSESILKPLTNKVIKSTYYPGSTFKVIPAMAGLHYKLITPKTTFRCEGCLLFGSETKCCWNKWGHGDTNLRRSLKESCDIYYYNLSERLGLHRLTEFAGLLNVGRETGIDLPGEEQGTLPTRQWFMQNHPGQKINTGYLMNMGIGQGDIRLTPLQIAIIYAAIANRGIVMKPVIARAIISPDNRSTEIEPETVRVLDIDPKIYDAVTQALWAVTNEEGGTAWKYIDHTIEAIGKTGTSQIISNTERKSIDFIEEDRKLMTTDDALFAAIYPYKTPEIVAVAVLESGAHGGEAAAPLVYRMLKSYQFKGKVE